MIYHTNRWLLFGCLVISCAPAFAEVSGQMESQAMEYQAEEIKIAGAAAHGNPLRLPRFSEQEEQEILKLIEDKTRFFISIPREANVGANHWENVGREDGFDIWQLHIYSPDAFSLQVDFSEFALQESMMVKVYGTSDSQMPYIGEYTSARGYEGNFTSISVPGDTVVVEAWMPAGSGVVADFPFKVRRIYHQFRDSANNVRGVESFSLSNEQSHSTCPLIDGRCNYQGQRFQPWRATVQMRAGGYSCSGALINSRGSFPAGSALVLTAYHCIDNLAGPEAARGTRINATFDIGSSPCAPGDTSIAVASGARFVAANAQGDYALLLVENIVATDRIVFMGWSATRQPVRSVLDIFHHGESISTQQYARSEVTGFLRSEGRTTSAGTLFSDCGNSPGCSHYDLHSVEGGIREGSSGGGYFINDNGTFRLNAVATHGNRATCTQSASLFQKIYEDGRVRCALGGGGYGYISQGQCDDSRRPSYAVDEVVASGGGGGGGAISLTELLALFGLVAIVAMRRRESLLRKQPTICAKKVTQCNRR